MRGGHGTHGAQLHVRGHYPRDPIGPKVQWNRRAVLVRSHEDPRAAVLALGEVGPCPRAAAHSGGSRIAKARSTVARRAQSAERRPGRPWCFAMRAERTRTSRRRRSWRAVVFAWSRSRTTSGSGCATASTASETATTAAKRSDGEIAHLQARAAVRVADGRPLEAVDRRGACRSLQRLHGAGFRLCVADRVVGGPCT